MAMQQREPQMLASALAYARRGWRVFPLQPNSKVPYKGSQGFKDATTDPETIRRWWTKAPRANIGIATGSGLIVIDEDTYKGADASAWVLPVTLSASTARGGRHYFYVYDGPLPCVPEGKLAPGICIKADGGYVVASPSTFNGKPYTWDDNTQPLANFPERMARIVRGEQSERKPAQSRQHSRGESDSEYWVGKAIAHARSEGRNNAGAWLAVQLRDNDCADPERAMLYYASMVRDWDTPLYTDREALATLRSITSRPPREPARSQNVTPIRRQSAKPAQNITKPITDGATALQGGNEPPVATFSVDGQCTDMGNARRFVARHGENVRHVATWGQWLIWDGKRWKRDSTGEAYRLAKDTVVSIYQEAADCDDHDERKELAKWAIKSQSDARIKAMLSVVQTEPEIACASEGFDNQPWLLTVENGTLDLRTGRLVPHDRGHLITRLAPVKYDPAATCPAWLAFLDQIMGGDANLVSFIQRAVGYSLSDDTGEQVLFLLHGSGQNGKSRLLEAIEGVMGDYGMQTPTSTLMAKRDNSIPNDVARLKGARFVKAIETEEGHSLAESLVKQMTGGDMLSARFMRGEWFDFKPTFKLWLAANHLPNIRGSDEGIWRRIRYIPFAVQIPEAQRDNKLGDKLRREYAGILAWAVRGCLDWQRDGLGYPERVKQATQQYREQMDHFGRFVADCCLLKEGCQVSAKALRQSYETWCSDNGERARSQTWVGKELQRMMIAKFRDGPGNVCYAGIGLRAIE